MTADPVSGTTGDLAAAEAALHATFGFKAFRPGQAEIIENVLAGRDASNYTDAEESFCIVNAQGYTRQLSNSTRGAIGSPNALVIDVEMSSSQLPPTHTSASRPTSL